MSKIFRIVSTVMIAAGIVFLFFSAWSQGGSRTDILDQPSFYTVQNYRFLFAAGAAVVGFSLMGSFFSWFKGFDTSEEILPNAGYASGRDIDAWIGGAAGNAGTGTEILPDEPGAGGESRTGTSAGPAPTAVLGADGKKKGSGKTEVLAGEESLTGVSAGPAPTAVLGADAGMSADMEKTEVFQDKGVES